MTQEDNLTATQIARDFSAVLQGFFQPLANFPVDFNG
jgi:hypothetical protein